MRETYRREPSSSSYVLVSRSLEDGTWGLLVSWSLTVRSSSLGRVIIDRGMEVDFGNVWGRTSSLPCPCNLCGNACGAWPAYQGCLVMIYHGFSRPLTGPQSSGRCLAFLLNISINLTNDRPNIAATCIIWTTVVFSEKLEKRTPFFVLKNIEDLVIFKCSWN